HQLLTFRRSLYISLLVISTTSVSTIFFLFFFNDTATTEIYTLSLHDALPISRGAARALETSARRERGCADPVSHHRARDGRATRSEEHTSELQSLRHLVCRLLLEKKKKKKKKKTR